MMNLLGGASRKITSMLTIPPDDGDDVKTDIDKNDEQNINEEEDAIDPERKSAEEVGINTTLIASMLLLFIKYLI